MAKPVSLKLNVNVVDEEGNPSTLKAEIDKWVASGAGSLRSLNKRMQFQVVRESPEPPLAWSRDVD